MLNSLSLLFLLHFVINHPLQPGAKRGVRNLTHAQAYKRICNRLQKHVNKKVRLHSVAIKIKQLPKICQILFFRTCMSKKITASDVAARAGVSKWTVSRAFTEGASISESAKARVIKAAEELDYQPNLLARSLSKQRSNLVGVVVDEIENPNLSLILNRITTALQDAGFLTVIINISKHDHTKKLLNQAAQFQVDALIFLGTVLKDELVSYAQKIQHIPLIVMYRNASDPHLQVVSTDGFRAGQAIAHCFMNEGFTRFGYLAGPQSETTKLRRQEGFKAALEAEGHHLHATLPAEHYCRQEGYDAMHRYLQNTPAADRIHALFCENDILAIGAMDALHETGTSMAIIGFDDIDLAASSRYLLTTYRQPIDQLIKETLKRIQHPKLSPERYLIEGELILRNSHKPH
jgi:DNA-binding LacI/PurR family transcriptional regulator